MHLTEEPNFWYLITAFLFAGILLKLHCSAKLLKINESNVRFFVFFIIIPYFLLFSTNSHDNDLY